MEVAAALTPVPFTSCRSWGTAAHVAARPVREQAQIWGMFTKPFKSEDMERFQFHSTAQTEIPQWQFS